MTTFVKRVLSIFIATILAFTPGCSVKDFDSQANYDEYGCVMYFMDVGQADCCLIKSDGEYMLIDGGNNDDADMIIEYLKSNDIGQLKYVVATHPHEDHIGGLDDVLYEVDVDTVIIPDCDHSATNGENLLKAIKHNGSKTVYAKIGDKYTMGKGSFEVLGPVFITEDMNANSICLRFDYGKASALFTGDAERNEESAMINRNLLSDIDILKVGHHGSSEGSSYNFLRTTMPEYAVISCGKDNSYGHPHDEAVSRLEDSGATIYRTDEMGGIVFFTNGDSIKVTTADIESESPVNKKLPNDTTNESSDVVYIGNIKSKSFHREDCSGLPMEKNRVYFTSKEEAQQQGYTQCGNCKP